jgi:SAM-dependent methyltransferase
VLGGTHNYPADQEAARQSIAHFPLIPVRARANRALLRRMVRHLAEAGINQFLDIGSGMPTVGNVHEVVQAYNPQARVVYVDIDPVVVSESMEILAGNDYATAIHGDLRRPQNILEHPKVRSLLDFDQPIALLLVGVLHFVPDDAEAYKAVADVVGALAPGSYLAISHSSAEGFELGSAGPKSMELGKAIYRHQTATPVGVRTREQVARFFDGTALVEPGLVWMTQWRPDAGEVSDFDDDPPRCGQWAGVAQVA